jgi:hypothetical protein
MPAYMRLLAYRRKHLDVIYLFAMTYDCGDGMPSSREVGMPVAPRQPDVFSLPLTTACRRRYLKSWNHRELLPDAAAGTGVFFGN